MTCGWEFKVSLFGTGAWYVINDVEVWCIEKPGEGFKFFKVLHEQEHGKSEKGAETVTGAPDQSSDEGGHQRTPLKPSWTKSVEASSAITKASTCSVMEKRSSGGLVEPRSATGAKSRHDGNPDLGRSQRDTGGNQLRTPGPMGTVTKKKTSVKTAEEDLLDWLDT